MDRDWAQLLRRISDGESAAENELVSYFWRPAFLIAQSQLRNAANAQDVTQEALMIVLQKARNEEILEPRALEKFVSQTVKFCALGFRRKQRETLAADLPLGELPDVVPDDRSVLEQLSHEALIELLRAVIDELPQERDRDVLRRWFLYQQSADIIAAHLDIDDDAVYRIVYRAKKRLATRIKARPGGKIELPWIAIALAVLLLKLLTGSQSAMNGPLRLTDPHLAKHYRSCAFERDMADNSVEAS